MKRRLLTCVIPVHARRVKANTAVLNAGDFTAELSNLPFPTAGLYQLVPRRRLSNCRFAPRRGASAACTRPAEVLTLAHMRYSDQRRRQAGEQDGGRRDGGVELGAVADE